MWYAATRRRSIAAFRAPLALLEYVAGCPRYMLMHTEMRAARPVYYGHRSLKRLEEHARELLVAALRAAEGEP